MSARRILGAAGALALVFALPGCSSPPMTASLGVLAGSVEVAAGSGDFAPAMDGMSVTAGDVICTGGDGRAEIAYPDGSITRLDVDTTLALVTLAGSAGAPQIEARQESGNTFHRVVALTEAGSRFEVATPTAIAGVQGTTFAVLVDAGGATTVAVVADAVAVTAGAESVTVDEGLTVDVSAGGVLGAPEPTPPEIAQGEWLTYNRVEDGEQAPAPPLGPEAFFEAALVLDHVGINFYPPGAHVLVVVRDTPEGPEVGRGQAIVDAEGFARVDFAIHLRPGEQVTVIDIDNGAVRDTTIVPLEITSVDRTADLVAGTADPGTRVVVYVERRDGERLLGEYEATAGADGTWQVAATDLDLGPEHLVTARTPDADGDTTLAFAP